MDRPMLSTRAHVQGGKLFLPRRSQFDQVIAGWPNCSVMLRLEQARPDMSAEVRGFYFAGCVSHVSAYTGHTEAETHDLLKAMHLPRRLHAMRGGAICWQCARLIDGSTRQLDSWEMSRYIAAVHEWAAVDLGLVLPEPTGGELVAA
jgi:hypothetical protein